MSIRRPNFLVAGAQKCGTSYLCAALSRHASVFHTNPKEPLFFQRPDVTESTFLNYLAEFYGLASNEPLVGEGSTIYFQWHNALGNIVKYLGKDIKVIVCLRHPTDRAVSFYLHNLRKGRFGGSERIAEVGTDVRLSPVLSGLYSEHAERWLDALGGRIQFMLFDDLIASPEKFVTQATGFLGIDPPTGLSTDVVNKGFPLTWQGDILTLTEPARGAHASPKFSLAELEDLHSRFLDDISRTARVVGRPLDSWKLMPDFTQRQSAW